MPNLSEISSSRRVGRPRKCFRQQLARRLIVAPSDHPRLAQSRQHPRPSPPCPWFGTLSRFVRVGERENPQRGARHHLTSGSVSAIFDRGMDRSAQTNRSSGLIQWHGVLLLESVHCDGSRSGTVSTYFVSCSIVATAYERTLREFVAKGRDERGQDTSTAWWRRTSIMRTACRGAM